MDDYLIYDLLLNRNKDSIIKTNIKNSNLTLNTMDNCLILQ